MFEPSIIGALMSLVDAGMLPGALVYAARGSALAELAEAWDERPLETRHTRFHHLPVNTTGFYLTVAISKL